MAGDCWPTAPTSSTWAANSTAPGSRPITGEQELARLEPVVRALAHEAIALDRHLPRRHRRTLHRAGCRHRQRRLRPARRPRHGGGDPRPAAGPGHDARQGRARCRTPPTGRPTIVDLVRDVADWLSARVDAALAAGIAADQIVLDPGWGKFLSLEPAHSWELLARFDELVERLAPFPVVVGISRKGFFGVPAGRARSALAADQPRGGAEGGGADPDPPCAHGGAVRRRRRSGCAWRCRRGRPTPEGCADPASSSAAVRPNMGWRQSGQTSQNGASTKSRLCISGWGRRRASSSLTTSSSATRSRSISRGRQRAVSRAPVPPEPGLDAMQPGQDRRRGQAPCAAGRRR